MQKDNLMSERMQPDRRPIEDVIAKIEALYNSGRGDSPIDDPRFMSEKTCRGCGRPLPTDAAWDELEDGNGTNLCWGDCLYQGECLTVPILDAMRLVDEIRRLPHPHEDKRA